MILLDSNIWIGFFSKDDNLHTSAVEIFEALQQSSKKILITEYVILETTSVLSQRVGKELANAFINRIDNSDRVIIQPSSSKHFKHLVYFYTQSSYSKLSFVDHHLLLLSKLFEVKTFDRELAKLIREVQS